MPLLASETGGAGALLAGLALGLCVALPAQAFTPFSGPILSASPVAPNVVVLFDNSSSMVLNHVDGQTRLDLARAATKTVIADNRHLRFGLFTFREAMPGDRGPGGVLQVETGSIAADSAEGVARFEALNRALDSLEPGTEDLTWTPLAESWYEVTRYLRGMRAFYPQSLGEGARDAFVSPIEYRCQKNFGLIVTDGLPTYDSEFPDNLADEPDGNNPRLAGSFNLPDWDGDAADLVVGTGLSSEGSSFYLDDIARFAYETDLRRDGTDGAGKSWNDPQFPLQNLRTYTLGFTLDDPLLGQVASAGNGRYFTANDGRQLQRALTDALRDMSSSAGSGGGAVSDSQQLAAGSSRYYQTGFDPADWSGSLSAYQLNTAAEPETLLWSTDESFLPGSPAGQFETWRHADETVAAGVVSLNHTALGALSATQQRQLQTEAGLAGLHSDGAGQRLLDWARGADDADLRSRSRLLGDIIHSAPVLVGAGHHKLIGHQPLGYASYLTLRRDSMTEAIVLGANDGFLRIFNTSGTHLYSYLPAATHVGLGVRARSDYGGGNQHRAGVDGRIAVADVLLGTHWTTVAAAGMGAGGKGLFALRLFDDAAGNAARGALWEADPEQHDALGHIYGAPALASLGGQPVLITGNGYGSQTGQAALLIFDLHTGALLKQLEVSDRSGASGRNGLSVPVLQLDDAGQVRAAFAGDLQGQLWKFELAGADPDRWQVAHDGTPLFSAGEGQPITVQPLLHPNMTGDSDLLLFGTGKWLEAVDLRDDAVQAFYAVLDTPVLPAGGLTPASLQQQQISSMTDPVSGQPLRTVSSLPVDWRDQYGWYLPLTEDALAQGERITREAVIRHSRVMFTTSLVSTVAADPCLTQASGWLMSIALANGGMPAATVLDTTGDRRVDGSDSPAAGLALGIGLPGQLSIIDQDEPGRPPGCNAELYLIRGAEDVAVLSGVPQCQFNRIMWRQLQ